MENGKIGQSERENELGGGVGELEKKEKNV